MAHVSAGKVDTTENDTPGDSACPPPESSENKQEITKEDFPVCHKVTGSQSSIDHDKSEVKRNAGHRSKSFLEEPSRSKAASFMQSKHGDSSNRSTHGSHGDGITPSNLVSKGFSVSETIRNGDQHKIFEVEKSDIFTPTSTGSTQKLFDSEVTFADLVRVCTASTTKPDSTKLHVGNALLSSPHASTVVSNYLNSYRHYLSHLRHSGAVSASPRDPSRPQPTTFSNVPLVLPLSRMIPVFTDESHNDPEFVDLLKKTTTESIRNLWPCRGKPNIFCKAECVGVAPATEGSRSEQTDDPVLSEDVPTSEFSELDEGRVCSQKEDNCSTQYPDQDGANTTFGQNSFQGICQQIDADNVSGDRMRELGFCVSLVGESSEVVYDLKEAESAGKSEPSAIGNPGDAMVKTMTDSLHNFNTSVPSSQPQTTSACWSDAVQEPDGDGKLSHGKTSHLNKLLQLQQKLLQQQHLQRQLMQHQQRQQHQHHQQQQQSQLHQDQQMIQQFQNKKVSQDGDLQHYQQHEQQQQQQQQQLQDQQQQQHKLGHLQNEKKQFSVDAKPWYQLSTESSQPTEGTKATLSTGTQLTSIHTSKADFQSALQAGIGGFDQCTKKQASGQRCYPGGSMSGFPQPGVAMTCHQSTDTPAQLRTLKASYACLDPQQPNAILSADQMFGPLREDGSIKLGTDLPSGQPFCVEPFEGRAMAYTPDDNGGNSRSWPCVNPSSLAGIPRDDIASGKQGVCKENRWSSTVDNGVHERLKRAYARTVTGDFSQGGAWATEFPADGANNQQAAPSKGGTSELFGDGVNSHGLGFQDQNMFYDTLENSIGGVAGGGGGGGGGGGAGVLGFIKDHNSWHQPADPLGSFDGFDYSAEGYQDPLHDTRPLQGLSNLEQGSRLSRLYQWRADPDGLPGPGCELAVSSSNDALLAGAQSDRDFSWNASSVASQLEQQETYQGGPITRNLCSPAVGDGPGVFSDRASSMTLDRKHQAVGLQQGGTGVTFDAFRDPGLETGRAGIFQERIDPQHHQHQHQQQHSWSNQGTQSSVNNMRTVGVSSLSCGPFLSHSMQVLNNKILSAQNESSENRSNGAAESSPRDMVKSGGSQDSSNGQAGTGATSQQPIISHKQMKQSQEQQQQQQQQLQQQQQQQQQQQHSKQGSVLSLSDDLEKTYINDGLVSKPWHELASEDQATADFQFNGNGLKQVMSQPHHCGSSQPFTATQQSVQSKDKCSHNNSTDGGGTFKDQGFQGRQVNIHRPRLILGANSVQSQKQRDNVQAENLEESNRRLREMLGLNSNTDQMGKPTGQGIRIQESLAGQAQQLPTGMMTNATLQGHVMTNATMNGPGARLQIPSSTIQSSLGMNPQMYCVPNILMPPPQAQSANTSRPSSVVLGGVNSSTRFPGMIRVPYVDMSRVVYIQQMPVNVSSGQTTNNNHNNSTSSNPHVNVSNIITINTDKDFSNGGLPEKPARLVRQNVNKNKTTFLKVRSGSEEYAVPILGMRPSLEDQGCTRQMKPRTNPWDQDLDQDFNSSLLSKAKSVEQVAGLGNIPTVGECAGGAGEPGKSSGPGAGGGGTGPGSAGATSGADPNLQMATFMQWPASADMHPEMLDMLPVRRAGPDDCGMGGRVCWPDMEFMLTSRDQLQSARRSNKPMGSNKANLISIIPRGSSADSQGGSSGGGQKDLELS